MNDNNNPFGPLKSNNLKGYLNLRNFREEMPISDELSFHWMNWAESCRALKKNIKGYNSYDLKVQIDTTLDALKTQMVWVCNKITVKKITLFELYESYLDSRIRLNWFNRFEEILYSLYSAHGPFISLSTMKWFNFEVYELFIMKRVLTENYPLRTFRLNARIPCNLTIDPTLYKLEHCMNIHELSETGVVFKITDRRYIFKIINSPQIILEFNLGKYLTIINKNADEIIPALQAEAPIVNLSYSINTSVFKKNNNLKMLSKSYRRMEFLHVNYSDLNCLQHDYPLNIVLGTLVAKIHYLMQIELEDLEMHPYNLTVEIK